MQIGGRVADIWQSSRRGSKSANGIATGRSRRGRRADNDRARCGPCHPLPAVHRLHAAAGLNILQASGRRRRLARAGRGRPVHGATQRRPERHQGIVGQAAWYRADPAGGCRERRRTGRAPCGDRQSRMINTSWCAGRHRARRRAAPAGWNTCCTPCSTSGWSGCSAMLHDAFQPQQMRPVRRAQQIEKHVERPAMVIGRSAVSERADVASCRLTS